MIVRLVKLTLQPKHCNDFLKNFEENKKAIGSFPGCSFLQLVRDIHNPNVFFTISHWDKEESLLAYRDSELFKKVWAVVSPMFEAKAEAWSTEGASRQVDR